MLDTQELWKTTTMWPLLRDNVFAVTDSGNPDGVREAQTEIFGSQVIDKTNLPRYVQEG